jgi:hypothetical protein
MSSPDAPNASPPAFQQWFARLGNSGKLLMIGGVAGIIATLLPLISSSIEVLGMASASQTLMVVDSWQGRFCLAGYIGAIILGFILYKPTGAPQKQLNWALLGVGGLTVLFAVILLIRMMQATSNMGAFGMGTSKVSVGIGAYLNVLTAAAVAAGGFLKAREEKLI